MVTQAYPSLNDSEPSWADIGVTATVDGGQLIEMADVAAIKWSDKVEVGVRKGTSGGRVMARTAGEISYEASATLYRGGHRRLVRGLMAKAPVRGNQSRIGQIAFDILIQHTP